jgi:hypothetical protein
MKKRIEANDKRRTLLVSCKNMKLIIIGCGKRTAEQFESYAYAGQPAPMEIEEISGISWIKNIDIRDLEILEKILP